MHIIIVVFEEKSMLRLQGKKEAVQECLQLLSFLKDFDDNKGRRRMTQCLILSMAGTTATFWGPSDDGEDYAVRYFEFPGGHSNILKSTESNMWTALQTCDKNEGRRREAK